MGSRGMSARASIGTKGATRRRTPFQGKQRGLEFARMKRIKAATPGTGRRPEKVAVKRGKRIDKNKTPADRT